MRGDIMAVFDEQGKVNVDVIIPIYRPDDKLYSLLSMLEKQSLKPKNIFILRTYSDKAAHDGFKAPDGYGIDMHIHYIEKKNFDHGGTRRYGASLSSADVLMFMTQDAVPVNEFLIEELVRPYKDNRVAATYARQVPEANADIIERFTREFNYPKESMIKSLKDLDRLGIKTYFCSNVCATYRRDIYEKLGGFVDKTIFNEDMIMAHAIIHAGYMIAYRAEAMVVHSHVYSYLQQFSRNFDLGVSHRQYADVFLKVRSESEGMRLFKSTLRYLVDRKEYLLIPDLVLCTAFKYMGYKLGVNYHRLPREIVLRCTMNKDYWNDGFRNARQ
jgi:rhamnosyltransferase